MSDALVRMENIVKKYGVITALRGVSLAVNQQEILGLVGDNGAGKSTLIKVLSGATRATSGDIYFKGEKVNISSTMDAINLGIETIYQDSALVTQLSVARNLFLGREPTRRYIVFPLLDKKIMDTETRKLMRQVGITKNIDPTTPISALSGGERQSIAIARAMYFKADLIILDEPTNNLGVEESQGVLRFVREAREEGHSAIFITHNIYHVFQVVDRIVILRHGEIVGNVRKDETSIDEVEQVITGMKESIWSAELAGQALAHEDA
jgi:simple sugar transport system ATP-binding protein